MKSVLNISPRFVWERHESFDGLDVVVAHDQHDKPGSRPVAVHILPGKPYIPTYREIMRARELLVGYKGRWMK